MKLMLDCSKKLSEITEKDLMDFCHLFNSFVKDYGHPCVEVFDSLQEYNEGMRNLYNEYELKMTSKYSFIRFRTETKITFVAMPYFNRKKS